MVDGGQMSFKRKSMWNADHKLYKNIAPLSNDNYCYYWIFVFCMIILVYCCLQYFYLFVNR
jgi:hypothetical protein